MGRRSLEPDEGLFLATNSIHMLFMRFPIDAVFIGRPDTEQRSAVLAVRHELPRWRGLVLPVAGAMGVVELPAGTLRRAAVEVGDTVRLEAAAADVLESGPGER
jgi:uncharacterized membrane protein (UPF0127 family)